MNDTDETRTPIEDIVKDVVQRTYTSSLHSHPNSTWYKASWQLVQFMLGHSIGLAGWTVEDLAAWDGGHAASRIQLLLQEEVDRVAEERGDKEKEPGLMTNPVITPTDTAALVEENNRTLPAGMKANGATGRELDITSDPSLWEDAFAQTFGDYRFATVMAWLPADDRSLLLRVGQLARAGARRAGRKVETHSKRVDGRMLFHVWLDDLTEEERQWGMDHGAAVLATALTF